MLQKIKNLCKERGITVSDLENLADLKQGTVCNWGRNGRCMPAADKLARVASVLGTTVEELLKEG